MADIFRASGIKISRAIKHLCELEYLLSEHLQKRPPEFVWTPQDQAGGPRVHVTTFSPPAEFSAIVGDTVHNLRAALDLLAVELVVIGSPNLSTKSVQIPFSESDVALPAMIKKRQFQRAGADAVALLVSLRPYHGGDPVLRGLHDLDIQDKHRELIPSAAAILTPMLRANADNFPDVKIELVEGSSPGVSYVFPNGSPFAGDEIIPTLHQLVKLVEDIIDAFANLVASRT